MLGDTVSKWIPEQSPKALAHLGKLGEECCELGKSLFRSIIQGIDGTDPKDGESNREKIQDEIADVLALADLNIEMLDLDREAIDERRAAKLRHKRAWLAMLDEIEPEA